jgi:hypothetical protein
MIAFGLVAALLLFYWMYVRGREQYFVHRNLRILSSFSGELDGAFVQQATFVQNYARAGSWDAADRRKLLRDFDETPCGTQAFPGAAKATDAEIDKTVRATPGGQFCKRALSEHNGVQWLEVAWAGLVPIGEGVAPGIDTFHSTATEPQTKPLALCRQIALSRILEPLLNRERFGAFDSVFIADGNGRVLYSFAPPHATSTLLWQAIARKEDLQAGAIIASKMVLTNVDSMQEYSGVLGRERVRISPKSLISSSLHANVEISGDPYVLFTHPYAFQHPAGAETNTVRSDKDAWVVGGIVARDRFQADVRAISASKVALAIALCVLVICAWPFIRISLLTEHQPLTITDVALVAICSIVGVMLLTIMLLDWLAYQRMSMQTDAQLSNFAYRLEYDYTRDVIAASKALDGITRWSRQRGWTGSDEWNLVRRASGTEADVRKLYDDPNVARYPYFSAFSWIDRSGMQRYKASTGARLALVNVADRDYFKQARDRLTWDAQPRRDGGEQHPYALEWVRALTTGDTQAVLAKNTGNPELPVVALTTQLVDVVEAVPPPGVSFAIIDEQGNVVYHPDEQRIGREDFFAETDFDRELRGAVLSRTDAFVTCSYWGEDQRLFAHPLANTQWTLVAFRGKRLVRAINIEALLLTLLALMANALPYVLIAVLLMVIWPWYRAPYLWPDTTRIAEYGRLTAVMGLAAITFSLSTYAITPADLFPIILVLPLQAVLSGYVLLHGRDMRRMSLVALLAWIVLTRLLVWSIAMAHIDSDLLVSAKPGRMKWLLIAVVLFESVVALKMMMRRRQQTAGTSIESLIWWAFLTAVAAFMAARAHLETLPAAFHGWANPFLVLLVLLASVIVLRGMIVSDSAPARRKWLGDKILALVARRWQRMAALWVAIVVAMVMTWLALPLPIAGEIAGFALLQAIIGTIWLSNDEWAPHHRTVIRLIWSAVGLALMIEVAFRTSYLPKDLKWAEGVIPVVYFLALILTVAVADGRPCRARAWKIRKMVQPIRYPASYRLAGVLTLIVCAALPTLSYFKMGSRIEQAALVKYAQLRMASAIEHRINLIGKSICTDSGSSQVCLGGKAAETALAAARNYQIPNVWDTLWNLDDQPRRPSGGDEITGAVSVHELLATYIPHYSEDSVAMRQLYSKASADPLWNWRPEGRLLTLNRLVRLDAGAAAALWPGRALHQQSLRFTSYIPLLFPSTVSLGTTQRYVASPLVLNGSLPQSLAGSNDVGYTVLCAILVVGFVGVLYWITRFITDRVLLVNVQDPTWIETDRGGALGEHVFLTRRAMPLRRVIGPCTSAVISEVCFADLAARSAWTTSLRDIDLAQAQNVRVLDFEYAIDDPAVNLEKLKWLEHLVGRIDRSVLIVSTVTPTYVLTLASTPKVAERWKVVLSSFLWVAWEEVLFRRRERRKTIRSREEFGETWTVQRVVSGLRNWQKTIQDERVIAADRWLRDETASSPVLRRIGRQIAQTVDRELIIDELSERAEPYYGLLWSTCSSDDKLLLFHLARYGFVHSKNRRTMRRLIARGLVRRNPNLELLSETFRLYVVAAGTREDLPARVRSIENESAWRAIRVPIFIVVISFLLLLFTTQKDLLTLTTGFATAITTGLPILVNLFGMFTQRRLETIPKVN